MNKKKLKLMMRCQRKDKRFTFIHSFCLFILLHSVAVPHSFFCHFYCLGRKKNCYTISANYSSCSYLSWLHSFNVAYNFSRMMIIFTLKWSELALLVVDVHSCDNKEKLLLLSRLNAVHLSYYLPNILWQYFGHIKSLLGEQMNGHKV